MSISSSSRASSSAPTPPPPTPPLAKKWKLLKRSMSPNPSRHPSLPPPPFAMSDNQQQPNQQQLNQQQQQAGNGTGDGTGDDSFSYQGDNNTNDSNNEDQYDAGTTAAAAAAAAVTEQQQFQSSKQWLHPDGQVIEEMTEEQEQEIYSIPASELSRHSRSSTISKKRGLLQRSLAAIRNGNHPHFNGLTLSSHANAAAALNNNNASSASSSLGRLQSSYKLLEDDYCQLKFEQTELVALADQRKMEKARSAELLESLDEEIRTRRKINLNLRLAHDKAKAAALSTTETTNDNDDNDNDDDDMPPRDRGSSKHQELTRDLNYLWLQRDLADHKFQEARDALYILRNESHHFLEELQTPPVIAEEVVRQEMARLRKEARVDVTAEELQQLTKDVQRLRPKQQHQQENSSNSNSHHHASIMIGKEILVNDEDSTKDTVSVTSTLFSDGNHKT